MPMSNKPITRNIVTLALIFIVLPMVSAVTINSGTVLNTTDSNSSMTFNSCTFEADKVETFTNAVTLSNLTVNETEFNTVYTFPAIVNHTSVNTNYNCQEIATEFGTASYLPSSGNLCPTIITSFSTFFSNVPALFGILGAAIIIGAVVLIFGAINGGFSMPDIPSINTDNLNLNTVIGAIIIILIIGVTAIAGIVAVTSLCVP